MQGSIIARTHEEQVKNSFTLHPYKDSRYVYDTEHYLRLNRLQNLKKRVKNLESEIMSMNTFLGESTASTSDGVTSWSLKRHSLIRSRSDVPLWSSFDRYSVYSHASFNEKSSLRPPKDTVQRTHVNELYKKVIGKNKKVEYSGTGIYQFISPRHGADTIVQVKACCFQKKPRRTQFFLHQGYSEIEAYEGKIESVWDESSPTDSHTRVNFIIPLYGRTKTFRRFLQNFDHSFLSYNENVSLFVIMYTDQNKEHSDETYNLVKHLKDKYQKHKIILIQKNGSFHRGVALQEASDYFLPDELLFFVDVDCLLSRDIVMRIRLNTIEGRQVYFPVMFSEYNPEFVEGHTKDKDFFSDEKGYWRIYSYGQVSIYKSDFNRVGGYDVRMRGWGIEDLDFVKRVLAQNITVFRSPDVGITHKYHPIQCDPNLPDQNYDMCAGTVYGTMGSSNVLYKWIRKNNITNNGYKLSIPTVL